MLSLTPTLRRDLRARAHPLHPVVAIGHAGLTPSVLHEIDVALAAHELIKVRVHSDDRDERERYLAEICEGLAAGPVQHLGKLLIVWRPKPAPERAERAHPAKPSARRPGARAETKGAAQRRGPPEPKIGPRARKHRRGAARHDTGATAAGARGASTRRRTARTEMAEPAVPTTSASRGGRFVDGKPATRPPRSPASKKPAIRPPRSPASATPTRRPPRSPSSATPARRPPRLPASAKPAQRRPRAASSGKPGPAAPAGVRRRRRPAGGR